MNRAPKRRTIAQFVILLLGAVSAASAMEKYVAIADVEAPNGDLLQTPIRIVIERLTTAEEREQLIRAIASGGSEAARSVLEKVEDLGYIEIEDRRAMLKFAYSQTVESESILTVVTAAPLAYLGSRRPEAKPVAGFDLAIATLYLDSSGRGRGELSPAAKVKVRENGLVTVLDYADKLVALRAVERKPE